MPARFDKKSFFTKHFVKKSAKFSCSLCLSSLVCPFSCQNCFGSLGNSTPNFLTYFSSKALLRVWIGVCINLADVTTKGSYTQRPTSSAVSAVVEGCKEAIENGYMTKAEAASLRGRAGWANSHSAGRCGRIGLEVLRDKQYRGPAR